MATSALLDSLSDAFKILDHASDAVCGQPSLRVFVFVRDARNYVRTQIDDLLAPIFDKEN